MNDVPELVVVLSTDDEFLHVGPRAVVERHVDHLSGFDVFDSRGTAMTFTDAPQGDPRLLVNSTDSNPSAVLARVDTALGALRALAERLGHDPLEVPSVHETLRDTLAALDRDFVLAPTTRRPPDTRPTGLPAVPTSGSPDSNVRELTANSSFLHWLAHKGGVPH